MTNQLKCPACNNSLENNIVIVDHEWNDTLMSSSKQFDFERLEKANKHHSFMEMQVWTCSHCCYMDG